MLPLAGESHLRASLWGICTFTGAQFLMSESIASTYVSINIPLYNVTAAPGRSRVCFRADARKLGCVTFAKRHNVTRARSWARRPSPARKKVEVFILTPPIDQEL